MKLYIFVCLSLTLLNSKVCKHRITTKPFEPRYNVDILIPLDRGNSDTKQEGQHPLTGQHAANFRLLANQ